VRITMLFCIMHVALEAVLQSSQSLHEDCIGCGLGASDTPSDRQSRDHLLSYNVVIAGGLLSPRPHDCACSHVYMRASTIYFWREYCTPSRISQWVPSSPLSQDT
jgi:hypothetical protein